MSILAEILDRKRREVEVASAELPLVELTARLPEAPVARRLSQALRQAGEVRAIAEIKRASPSAGAIRPGADPATIARDYAAAGAAAISVLTDAHYFDGRLEFIGQVRDTVELPILRKEFIIDPYQLVEARVAGADAILLIVAALDQSLLAELVGRADELGLESLVEVHDEDEVGVALGAGARLIGVNHRNLSDFSIDLDRSRRLRPLIPAGLTMVAESGIRDRATVVELAAAGVDAILVGEQLMRAVSPGAALEALLGRR